MMWLLTFLLFGCGGKSTLHRIIGGLIAPTTGRLWVDGEEIEQSETSLQQYRKKSVLSFNREGCFGI